MRVFIISDLHLGGRWGKDGDRGFRMMTCPERLARFIDRVADEAGPAELVINGDFIDFLAEENVGTRQWQAFVADEAAVVARLEALAGPVVLPPDVPVPPDWPVFDALHRLLARPEKRLTLLLGNHDLELGLPAVRAALFRRLGSDRIEFITDGEAHIVGDALIEHGNRYDGFNVVDQDAFRRLRSLLSRRRPQALEASEFTPPIGSELVATVMNPIKKDFAFVDQLKPEGAGLYGLLLALRPSLWRQLDEIGRFAWQAHKRAPKDGQPTQPGLRGAISADGDSGEGGVWRLLEEEGYPKALVADLHRELNPGSVRSVSSHIAALAAATRRKLVRAALRKSDLQAVWDPTVETTAEYLKAATALAKQGFRYVIFGHTHHARDVSLPDGTRYLNSGTWANLMRFPVGLAEAPDEELDAFLKNLSENKLLGEPQPHAVELVFEDDKVQSARLLTPTDLP